MKPIFSRRSFRRFGSLAALVTLCAIPARSVPFPGRVPGNKLTASDTANDDFFGQSVALSSNRALVGADGEDGAGSDRGAAYLYELATGAELIKLVAAVSADDDQFGYSVALSDDHALVGAIGVNGGGTDRGAACVFDVATGIQLDTLTASDAGDNDLFGYSVALSGHYAVVGAIRENGAGTQRGAAYVFDVRTGDELFKLTASDAEDGDFFGTSVAAFGNLALIGASGEDGAGGNRGAAYLFDLRTGTQLRKLTAADAADGDSLGVSVSLSESFAVVGAQGVDGGGTERGAAYVFNPVTGAQLFKLTASDSADNDLFGNRVAVSGNLAVVGATTKNGGGSERGAAYAFDLRSGAEIRKLEATDDNNFDRFGNSAALSGDLAIFGAYLKNNAGTDRGAAYVFQIDTFQPDLSSGSTPSAPIGNNVYNASAAGQTVSLTSRALRKVTGSFRLSNDGTGSEDYTLSATPGSSVFSVAYFRRSGAVSNVTAALLAGTLSEGNAVPGESGRLFSVEVTPSKKLRKRKNGRTMILRKTFTARLTAVADSAPGVRDAAAASVKTR